MYVAALIAVDAPPKKPANGFPLPEYFYRHSRQHRSHILNGKLHNQFDRAIPPPIQFPHQYPINRSGHGQLKPDSVFLANSYGKVANLFLQYCDRQTLQNAIYSECKDSQFKRQSQPIDR